MKVHTLWGFLSRLNLILHEFPIQEKKENHVHLDQKKTTPEYDIILACDLMEFPLRALACKIYFLLKAWRSRWPPLELDKLIKVKIFTVKKFILL